MIRWSALKVAESLDELEAIVKEVEPILKRGEAKAMEAVKLPCLPEYMADKLKGFAGEADYTLVRLRNQLNRARQSIPKDDLAREKASFERMLAFFNGDREKASLAMELGKPKAEMPKEQLSLLGDDGNKQEVVIEGERRQSYEGLSDEEMMEVDNSIMELIEVGKSAEDIVREISENYSLEKDQALTEAVQEGIKFYPEVRETE